MGSLSIACGIYDSRVRGGMASNLATITTRGLKPGEHYMNATISSAKATYWQLRVVSTRPDQRNRLCMTGVSVLSLFPVGYFFPTLLEFFPNHMLLVDR